MCAVVEYVSVSYSIVITISRSLRRQYIMQVIKYWEANYMVKICISWNGNTFVYLFIFKNFTEYLLHKLCTFLCTSITFDSSINQHNNKEKKIYISLIKAKEFIFTRTIAINYLCTKNKSLKEKKKSYL